MIAVVVLSTGLATVALVAAGRHHPDAASGTGDAGGTNPFRPTERSLAIGKTVYVRHCATCHGASGRGDGERARTLATPPADLLDESVADRSDAELFRKVSDGRRSMPAFRTRLPADNRWRVVLYLRTLAPERATGGGGGDGDDGARK